MTGILGGVYAFLFGAVIGSFLNVCVSRWPAGLSVVSPRSRCPNCGHEITAMENIPIISWIVLRAKCRGCGERISAQYPLVELANALLWVWVYLHFGGNFTALRVAVFGTLLLGISLTDAMHFVIPDGFTVSGLIWVMVSVFIGAFLKDQGPFATPWQAILGVCVGAGAIAVVGWLGEVALNRPAMGFGDSTMMAVVGGALGPERALLTIFIASVIAPVILLGLVYPLSGKSEANGQIDLAIAEGVPWKRKELPFGVFLAPAAFIALVYGERIIEWYLRVSGLR
ncbi:MAG: prepilin peptidase [Gemmatimonadota bacterium]|nr:prepilin peptidase [Gemmatimonadota bacterium]